MLLLLYLKQVWLTIAVLFSITWVSAIIITNRFNSITPWTCAKPLLHVSKIDRVHGYWLSKRVLILIETVPYTSKCDSPSCLLNGNIPTKQRLRRSLYLARKCHAGCENRAKLILVKIKFCPKSVFPVDYGSHYNIWLSGVMSVKYSWFAAKMH